MGLNNTCQHLKVGNEIMYGNRGINLSNMCNDMIVGDDEIGA